jgi:hypothetical protein
MTAEIAAMNLRGIALAADSAVTVNFPESPKVFHTADKIFELRSNPAVAVMVYGAGDFLGVPWEIVVERLRAQQDALEGVQGFRDAAVAILDEFAPKLRTPEQDAEQFVRSTRSIFEVILRRTMSAIHKEAGSASSRRPKLSASRARAIFREQVRDAWDFLGEARRVERDADEFEAEVRQRYLGQYSDLRREIFRASPVNPQTAIKLQDIAVWAACRVPRQSVPKAGIVFAGFGRDDLFPHLEEVHVRGVLAERAIVVSARTAVLTAEEPSVILPFAQADAVGGFVEGHHPEFQDVAEAALEHALSGWMGEVLDRAKLQRATRARVEGAVAALADGLREGLGDAWSRTTADRHVQPLMRTVMVAPVQELAQLAEWLVSLTSFKRRMTPGVESVGGPVDVCTLTRLDGFKWIRHEPASGFHLRN